MSTYKDIQRLTGLSLATISKYYNGRTVLAENRRAIEEAAEQLGFRPNDIARNLRSGRSRTVGVLLPALTNAFHLTIIAGVETALREAGLSLLVATSPGPGDDALGLLRNRMIEGIITVPPPHDAAALTEAARTIPVVAVDWDVPGLSTDRVVLDNRGAGAGAARLLLDHGHRRVGAICGDPAVSTLRDRAAGFRDEAGADGVDALIPAGPYTVAGGTDAMRRLLAARPRPTAVFCASHDLTLGALIAINDSGLRLGRDLSLVGFDARELALATLPRLTLFEQPTHEIAARAAERLLARLADPGADPSPVTVTVDPIFVAGASVTHRDDGPPDRGAAGARTRGGRDV
ncbi:MULTISPECIES: LacI family DNA-binding transcriptional regulator [Catenuloplanes]|uniref:LacI family transcriptional regulator n=1 Tax=Catenuloplanes niger TaxID=587534 RepID=A0AAE4A054_9ACTN|nr:LacI family DNA-binding transcriptional regulator [Catenuloplanes niger]MDR7328232.1 LacI family transcriptional regulator [Catenuloplanes niger]